VEAAAAQPSSANTEIAAICPAFSMFQSRKVKVRPKSWVILV
jgi:hypothetical protein